MHTCSALCASSHFPGASIARSIADVDWARDAEIAITPTQQPHAAEFGMPKQKKSRTVGAS